MKNLGQLWALVLATGASNREADSTSVPTDLVLAKRDAPPGASTTLLRYVVNSAATTAHRDRIWAVVTQQHRQRLKGPLWFLRASSFIVLPELAGTTHGILVGLLRILQRDPAAQIVMFPSNHHVRDEKPLIRSLHYAAAHTVVRPDELFILGVEPEERDPDLPGIVVGRNDRRGAFEVAQLVDKSSAAPRHVAVERRLLWNTGIVAGSAWALLRLIERRVPDIVVEAQAVIRGADPSAAAALNARLQGLDFHRHVLPGHERYLSVLPVSRSDLSASERSNARMRRAL